MKCGFILWRQERLVNQASRRNTRLMVAWDRTALAVKTMDAPDSGEMCQEIRARQNARFLRTFYSRGSRPYTKPREIRATPKCPDVSARFSGTHLWNGHILHEFGVSNRRSAQ